MANMKINYCGGDIFDGDISLPTDLVYNGTTLRTISAADTFTMNTKGKSMATNVTVGGKTLNTLSKFMRDNLAFTITSGGWQPPLPSEYQEVEYLICDKNQYIDTGILNNTYNYREATFISDSNKEQASYGGSALYGFPYMFWQYLYTGYGYTYLGTGKDGGSKNMKTLKIWWDNNGEADTLNASCRYWNKNDNNSDWTFSQATTKPTSTDKFYIAGYGPTYRNMNGKIFSVRSKASVNDTEYNHDFVPCYRKSDNKAGFYDIIGQQFYTNMGTGTDFGIGPIVYAMPTTYTRCLYLESTGTQRILTTVSSMSPNESIYLNVKGSYNVTNITQSMVAGEASNSTAYFYHSYTHQNKFRMAYGGSPSQNYDADTLLHNFSIYPKWNKYYIDDLYCAVTCNLTTALPINLFAKKNMNGVWSDYAKCKIYEFTMIDTDLNRTLHLIPCLDADGVPCMYDTVSNTTYYNDGTGTFNYQIMT